jgi:microcystin-dependent protein
MRLKIDIELPSWTKWLSGGLALGLVLGLVVAKVYADTVSVKTTFASGEVISAAEMNSNFQKLQDAVNQAAPPGTVVASFASSPPSGWLVADGSLIDAQAMPQYTALVGHLRALGTSFQGPGASQALLPDLRGMFLRGAGTNGSKSDATGTKYSGGSLGTYQQDQAQGHRHYVADVDSNGGGLYVALRMINAGNQYAGLFQQTGVEGAQVSAPIPDSKNGTPRVGSENKPTSYSIIYLIKY